MKSWRVHGGVRRRVDPASRGGNRSHRPGSRRGISASGTVVDGAIRGPSGTPIVPALPGPQQGRERSIRDAFEPLTGGPSGRPRGACRETHHGSGRRPAGGPSRRRRGTRSGSYRGLRWRIARVCSRAPRGGSPGSSQRSRRGAIWTDSLVPMGVRPRSSRTSRWGPRPGPPARPGRDPIGVRADARASTRIGGLRDRILNPAPVRPGRRRRPIMGDAEPTDRPPSWSPRGTPGTTLEESRGPPPPPPPGWRSAGVRGPLSSPRRGPRPVRGGCAAGRRPSPPGGR